MIAVTHRSTPAFAVGGVAHAFLCIAGGGEVAVTRFLAPRGICPTHCYDHNYEYDRYEREHRCIECDQPAPDDWYDI